MRPTIHPRFRRFALGIALAFAGLLPTCALADSPLGTQIAQFQRQVVEMVRDPVRHVIYATTTVNSVISVNTDTMVMMEIPIGSNPLGLDVSADGSRLYVANSGSTTAGLGVVDLTTFQALPSLPTPFAIRSVASGMNGHLYVLGADRPITQIDSVTGAVQAAVSLQSVIVNSGKLQSTPDRKTLFYGDFGTSPSTLYALDVSGSTPTLVQKSAFNTLGSDGLDLAITADGSALVYPNGSRQGGPYNTTLIPTADVNATIGTFNLGHPNRGAFSPDGSTYYVAPFMQGTLEAWSMRRFVRVGSNGIPDAGVLLVDQTGKYIFAATEPPPSGGSGSLTVYASGATGNPTITSSPDVTVVAGVAAKFQLTADQSNVTWSATGLPAGLQLDAATGVITGTVSTVETYFPQIRVTQTGGGSSVETLAIVVKKGLTSLSALGTTVTSFDRSVLSMIRDPNRPLIYATTTDNTVLAIDSDLLVIVAETSIGSNPEGLDISRDGTHLYVANSGSTTAGIGVVDLTTFTTLPSLATPFHVTSVAAGLNGHLYILGPQISQIDSASGTLQATVNAQAVSVYSGKLLCSPDRKTLYYGNFGVSPSSLCKFDVSGSAPVLTQTTGFNTTGSNGEDLMLTPNGGALVFPNGGYYQINVFPTNDLNGILGVFDTGAYPYNGDFSPDGSIFYTAPFDQGTMQIWNATTFLETGYFAVPALDRLLVDQLGRYIFASTDTTISRTTSVLNVYATGIGVTPLITSPSIFAVHEGAPVNFSLTSKENGVAWTAKNLPATLALDAQSGAITGSIATPGNYPVQVTATDRSGVFVSGTLTITVLTSFNVQINGQGSLGTGSPGTTWVSLGSAYSLTAVASPGNVFSAWSGSRSATTATISGTVTADMSFTATFVPATTLSATISGPGTVTSGLAGVTMQPLGGTVTIVATPDAGARFIGWTGDITARQASLDVTLNNPVSLTANFETIVYPTVTSASTLSEHEGAAVNFQLASVESPVTWSATNLPSELSLDPQSGLITGAISAPGSYAIQLLATDQYGDAAQATLTITVLTSFTVAINGQGTISGGVAGTTWVALGSAYALTATPDSGNLFTGWTGSQTTQTAAISGNVTADMTFTANFAPAAALTVTVSGAGTVPAEFAGTTTRLIGSSVTIQATPAAGAEFLGWTGDIVSSETTLNFTLNAAMSITANFAAINSFAGSYVFSRGAGAAPGPLTKLTASVNAAGNLTGKLTYGDHAFPFSGAFPAATGYAKTFTTKDGKSIWLQLSLSLATGHPVMTAMVTDESTLFSLTGYRLEKIPAGQSVAQKGRYTFFLPSIASAGYGHGTASVSKSGAVTFTGALGDGTAFTAAAQMTDSGCVLLSIPLYGKKGYLDGFLQFRDMPGQSDFDGALNWSQPVKIGGKMQANSIETTVQAVGSLFTPSAKGSPLLNFSSAHVTFMNGGLPAPSTTSVTIEGGNKVTPVQPDANALVCTLNGKTGAFSGSFTFPGIKPRRTFSGVVFLKNPSAAGCFKGPSGAGYGAVELMP